MKYNIFEQLQVTVNLKGNLRKSLSCRESNYLDNDRKYIFGDDSKNIEVIVLINKANDVYSLKVTAETKVEQPFFRQLYFEEEKAVEIVFPELKAVEESLSFYHYNDWWTRPYFQKDLSTLKDRTTNLLLKKEEGYFYFYPVVDKAYKTEISGSDNGLKLNLSSYYGGMNKFMTTACFIGYSKSNPRALFRHTIKAALEGLNNKIKLREEKQYPEILEGLGWCTWDAFYSEVSEEKILQKFEEFKQMDIPVKWVMIDDGWMDVEDKKLVSFEPDKEKFPRGFKYLTDKLKKDYGVEQVGVWHTFFGYWAGIKRDTPLYSEFKDSLYETNSGKIIPYPQEEKGYRFWEAWHGYLKEQGVGLVKVDGQSSLNNFTMFNEAIGEAAAGAHRAIEKSIDKHFNNTVINCMGMASENILNRETSPVSRNSDDFIPDNGIPFKEHLLQNAYNSLYHGIMYYVDFDMFWTKHEYAVQHAVLRALSGGPLYFSDGIGRSCKETIMPAILSSGTILRADTTPTVTEDVLFKNPFSDKIILKLMNRVKNTAVIGAFNIDEEERTIQTAINTSDFEGIIGESFIIYRYFSKEIISIKKGQSYSLALNSKEVEVLTAAAYDEDFTVLGLLDKYLSAAAVDTIDFINNILKVKLLEGGIFGIALKKEPKEIVVNGKSCKDYVRKGDLYKINCRTDSAGGVIVEIVY